MSPTVPEGRDSIAQAVGDLVQAIVVPDEMLACPGCGAYWGHPDKALNFPNRFKVDSFVRCYNPACKVAYYDPYNEQIEYESEK